MRYNLIFTLFAVFLISYGCDRSAQKEEKDMKKALSISKEDFGEVNGQAVHLYTLKNNNDLLIKITNYGGIITSIQFPDRENQIRDVALGFEDLQKYLDGHPYFGALIGRYANRIAEGKFSLHGEEYLLATNNGNNHLHGGDEGFDKKVWNAEMLKDSNSAGLQLQYLSPHMEEGYPGNLEVKVTYILNNKNELKINYLATTDKASPVNLTNHCYFNLRGPASGDILEHYLRIDAGKYTVVNDVLIPTGELRPVEGTAFDFREAKKIGKDIDKTEGGYDHNFVLNNPGTFRKVAQASSPESGIMLEVFTDQPGLQFYSGNFLDGSISGKNGVVYKKHYGFCLETQHFPDSPNQPDFPSAILEPDEIYQSTSIYKFSIELQ